MHKFGKSIRKPLVSRSLKWIKTVEEKNLKNTKIDSEFKGDLQKYAPQINSLQKSIDDYDLSDNMIVVGKKIGA